MIQAGLFFEASTEVRFRDDGYLVLTFKVSDLLSPKSKEIEELIAEFLNNINVLKEYGIMIETQVLTFSSGNVISFHLLLNTLTPMSSIIEELKEFETKKDTMDELLIELFENQLKDRLHYFDLNLPEEIERQNRKRP